ERERIHDSHVRLDESIRSQHERNVSEWTPGVEGSIWLRVTGSMSLPDAGPNSAAISRQKRNGPGNLRRKDACAHGAIVLKCTPCCPHRHHCRLRYCFVRASFTEHLGTCPV